MDQNQKTCTINLKSAHLPNGYSYGKRFESLEECCPQFKRWFNDTGGHKPTNFNQRSEYKDGFCLVSRGGEYVLVLRVTTSESEFMTTAAEDPIKFCPFCGSPVVIKVTGYVELR